jgi:hypothetical protein
MIVSTEILSAAGLAIGSGAVGYLVRQTSRVTRLEERTAGQEKLADVRFDHIEKALTKCASTVERLAQVVGGMNGAGDNDTALRCAQCHGSTKVPHGD